MTDSSLKPDYYEAHPSGVTCKQIINFLPFSIACVVKYVWRYENKGGKKDIGKAIEYVNILLEAWKANNPYSLDNMHIAEILSLIELYAVFERDKTKSDIFKKCVKFLKTNERGVLLEVLELLQYLQKREIKK